MAGAGQHRQTGSGDRCGDGTNRGQRKGLILRGNSLRTRHRFEDLTEELDIRRLGRLDGDRVAELQMSE